jgi:hypothetical protein
MSMMDIVGGEWSDSWGSADVSAYIGTNKGDGGGKDGGGKGGGGKPKNKPRPRDPDGKPKPRPDTPTDPTDTSAQAILYDFLDQYGLGKLAAWAWDLKKGGATMEEIVLAMYEQPAFIEMYPAYKVLAERGEAISLGEYRQYTADVRNYLHEYGIPKGMYDTPEAIGKLMINNVSRKEVQDRLVLAADAAYRAPKEVTDAIRERWNLGNGDLVAYWLDPDKALPLLEQQYKSAQVQGAAAEAGFATSLAQYDRLAAQGVDYATARRGYAEVRRVEDLTNTEFGQDGQITREELVGGAFGSAAEATEIERESARRRARYQAGEGGAAAGNTGVSGLRSARV